MMVYDTISDQFNQPTIEPLEDWIARFKDDLEKDKNYGIATQLLEVWRKNKLLLLAQTFVTLNLSEIASQLGLPTFALISRSSEQNSSYNEVERCILHAIKTCGLCAKIDLTSGLVYFEDSSVKEKKDHYLSVDARKFREELETATEELISLAERVREAQKESLTSQGYIMKVTSGRSGPSLGLGHGGTSSLMDL